MYDFIVNWCAASYLSFTQASPLLIVGFLCAGLLHVLIPAGFVNKWLSGKGIGPILRGSFIGMPMPLCSCSVIPVTRSLMISGASMGACASFLTSTPQIGFDAFILSQGLLGMPMAVLITVVAFISAILVGLLVEKFGTREVAVKEVKPCCQNKHPEHHAHSISSKDKIGEFLNYSFIVLPNDLFRPLVIGFILSGLIGVALPIQEASSTTGTLAQVFMMLVISVPTYVCAVSSVPVAHAFLMKGIAPAAVLVFLIAGPASNTTSIVASIELFGFKGMLAYVSGLVLTVLVAALTLSFFAKDIFINYSADLITHEHNLSESRYQTVCGLVLLTVLLLSKLYKYKSKKALT